MTPKKFLAPEHFYQIEPLGRAKVTGKKRGAKRGNDYLYFVLIFPRCTRKESSTVIQRDVQFAKITQSENDILTSPSKLSLQRIS